MLWTSAGSAEDPFASAGGSSRILIAVENDDVDVAGA